MIAAVELEKPVAMSRLFRGSPETVFRAWTDPEELKQWWCAPGFSLETIEVDLCVGGQYRFSMRRRTDDARFIVSGEYLEVKKPERLVYTWTWRAPGMDAADTRVAVHFDADGEATRITLTHEAFPDSDMQCSHLLGWAGAFDRLALLRGSAPVSDLARTLAAELRESRETLLEELRGLNESQWSFKPEPDLWSIAEIVEHLAIVEERCSGVIREMLNAPESPADLSGSDEMISKLLRDRSNRVKAPDPFMPSGKEPMPVSRANFVSLREGLASLLESNPKDLRRYSALSPGRTPLDGYQWARVVALHTLRHVAQVREVKLSVGYPA